MEYTHALWYGALAGPCLFRVAHGHAWETGFVCAALLWATRLRIASARTRRILGLACALALGASLEATALDLFSASQHSVDLRPGEGSWQLQVVSSPEPRGSGWAWTARLPGGPQVRVLLRGDLPGTVVPGAWIEVRGELDPPSPTRNPGGSAPLDYCRVRGLHGWIRVRSPAGVRLLRPGPWPGRALSALQCRVRAILREHLSPVAQAYAVGLVLGETGQLPEEDREGMVALGVVHVAVVSGTQAEAVAWLLDRLARGLPAALARVLVLLGTTFYAVLAHAQVPVTRSVLQRALREGARAGARPCDPGELVARTGLLLLCTDPRLAEHPSYLLSCAAAWGLSSLRCLRLDGPRWWAGNLEASARTQLSTLPVLCQTIGRGSWASLGANLLAVPLANALTLVALAAVAIALTGVPLPGCMWWPVEWSAQGLSRFSQFGARVLGVGLLLGPPEPVVQAAAILGLGLLAHGRGTARVLSCCLLVPGLLLPVLGPRMVPHPVAGLRLAFLDVGQGDAAVVTFPSGASVLVDAGPRSEDFDAGERVVHPALRALGIHELQAMVLSHSDSDHSGGASSLLLAGLARQVWIPPRSAGGRWNALDRAARGRGVAVREWARADSAAADERGSIRVLHPGHGAGGARENDLCLAVEVEADGGRALLPGDLEREGEAALVQACPEVRANILKVGHHGSRTSSTPEFLAAAGASVAVISVGRRNPFHHPSPEVEQRLAERGMQVLETRFCGAILLGVEEGRVRLLSESDWTCGNSPGGAPGRHP